MPVYKLLQNFPPYSQKKSKGHVIRPSHNLQRRSLQTAFLRGLLVHLLQIQVREEALRYQVVVYGEVEVRLHRFR